MSAAPQSQLRVAARYAFLFSIALDGGGGGERETSDVRCSGRQERQRGAAAHGLFRVAPDAVDRGSLRVHRRQRRGQRLLGRGALRRRARLQHGGHVLLDVQRVGESPGNDVVVGLVERELGQRLCHLVGGEIRQRLVVGRRAVLRVVGEDAEGGGQVGLVAGLHFVESRHRVPRAAGR